MTADLLLFRVGRELFATELRSVEEAVDLAEVRHVAAAAPPARGIVALRGALLPLFSPAAALGVAPSDSATGLVVRDGGGRIAILVDDVEDVLTVHEGELRPVPAGDARDTGVVRGIVRRGSNLVAIVNLEALVAACRGRQHPEAA